MKRLYALIVAAALCFPSIGAWAWWQSIQQVGVSAGGYTAQGVNFSATATLHKSGGLTGVTDSKTGMISFWFRANAGTDAQTIRAWETVNSLGNAVLIDRLATSDVLRIICNNAAGSTILSISTTATFAAGGGWKHFLASWNLATTTVQIYVEDAVDFNGTAGTNDTIEYATGVTDWFIPETGLPGPFDIADFWFDPNQTPLDLSVTANRRKFITAGLAPVNLGVAGATPTGTSPAVFFSGAVGSWNTNKGTGGGFTITAGSITAASSNPP